MHSQKPRIKSPTHTVIAGKPGNGQPAGQLDVGADLSDAELIRHVQDCGWRDVYPKDRLAKPSAIDPALAKLDADTRNTAPPPEEIRRRMAEITGRMKA